MLFFRNISIQQKLMRIIMLTSGILLVLVCIVFLTYEIFTFRDAMRDKLSSLASIIGINVASTLLFDDRETAEETLSALRGEPHVISAFLYKKDGQVFAKYFHESADKDVLPPPLQDDTHTFFDGKLLLFQPITFQNEQLGTIGIESSMEALDARIEQYGVIAVTIMFVSFLIAFLLSFQLQRIISEPILHLAKTMKKISTRNDYSLRMVPGDQDEVGFLIAGFNQMLNQIQKRDEKLKEHWDHLEEQVDLRTKELTTVNQQMQSEIKERKRIEQNLQNSNEELVTANEKLKSTQSQLVQSAKLASIGELATGIAHELNQPLTYIRNSTQLLLMDNADDLDAEEVFETLQQVEQATDRMMSIINHLRSFARESDIQHRPVQLCQVLENSLILLNEQLKNRNIRLEKKIDPQLPQVLGNSQQLEQVFINMLSNARDALDGREDPQIVIQVKVLAQDDGSQQVMICFIDNGAGIPSSYLEKIFDPFFSTKEEGKGTGLGLSISYGIIQDHQGEIHVSSTEGEGTTFEIILPVQ